LGGRQAVGSDSESAATAIHGTQPNKAWVTDITYVRTWQGWLYVAVVMDLFSRLIVGWAARPTIHRELVLDAVLLAVRRCRTNRLEPSMSRKGNCWDNAVAESFSAA
jgi:putative transposase